MPSPIGEGRKKNSKVTMKNGRLKIINELPDKVHGFFMKFSGMGDELLRCR